MTRVYLGVGSNNNPRHYLCIALQALTDHFGALILSSVYESEAIGFQGDNFLNMVVGVETDLPVARLSQIIKKIEDDNGRDRTSGKYSGRTLDIDLLTYGDQCGVVDGIQLPREEVSVNAFVLWPLAEVAAKDFYPGTDISFGQMWRNYDRSSQQLWPVDFSWRGKQISFA